MREDERGQDTSWDSYRDSPFAASGWLEKSSGLGGVYIVTILIEPTFL